MEVDNCLHEMAALLPGKQPGYSLERGIHWPQNGLVPVEKLSLSNLGEPPPPVCPGGSCWPVSVLA
jgi:hypothetical protein